MKRSAVCVVLVCLGLLAGSASALINPNFTPIHLVRDSQLILVLKPVAGGAKDAPVAFDVVEVLKGKTDAKTLTIQVAGVEPAQVEALRKAVVGRTEATFYLGKYREETGGGEFDPGMGGFDGGMGEPAEGPPEQAGIERALLHLGRPWYSIGRTEKGDWILDRQDDKMLGTWDGADDMLLRAVRYVLRDEKGATMPSQPSAASLAQVAKLPELPGGAVSILAVDRNGDGRVALFVVSPAGDRLLAWDKAAKAFADVSDAAGVTGKSTAAAFADINGDGRLDLVSWDGSALHTYLAAEDGKLAEADAKIDGDLPKDVLGVTSLDVGAAGKAGLLLCGSAGAVLLTPKADGGLAAAALPVPADQADKLGKAGAVLAADFDADGRPDVLVPFEKAGLLYLGTDKPGVFAAPAVVRVCFGALPGGACLGDWDADGLLDVFVSAADGCRMYTNLGKGAFVESIEFCGETYKTQPGGSGAAVCEINNDGRQDLLILYGAPQAEEAVNPQLYFNRGFRVFGYDVDANTNAIAQGIPGSAAGQRAGLMTDLNGDTAPDLALVLADGKLAVMLGGAYGEALGVRAFLPAKAEAPGPVTVTAWIPARCLGSWAVRPGDSGAYFGLETPAEITLKWRFPGGELQTETMEVEEGTTRFELKPGK